MRSCSRTSPRSAGWRSRDVLDRLAGREIDVLIVDAFDGQRLESMMRRGTRNLPAARVLVVLGVGDGGPLDALDIQVPAARSVLTLKGPPTDVQLRAVSIFLLALSHDLPLHEALVMARTVSPAIRADLAASPESLHDLRLTSVWAALERRLAELSGAVGPGTIADLSEHVSGLPVPTQDVGCALVTGVSEARVMMEVDFARESGGLHPPARAYRQLAEAQEAMRRLHASPAAPRAALTERPFRVVNIGLRRQGDILAPGALSTYVEASRSLVAGGCYDLDVQIGAPVARQPRRRRPEDGSAPPTGRPPR